MKLKSIMEGLSPVLYHSTDVQSLFSIVRTDKFRLTLDLGTDVEIEFRKGGKFYYLSTSRNKSGYFTQNQASGISNAMLVLDGRKLQARYSGTAVNYWSGGGDHALKNHELEDRLYSHEQYIPNASKYIKEVHILYDESKSFGSANLNHPKSFIKRTYAKLRRKGIPVYVYLNKRDYLTNRRDNAISPTELETESDETTFSNIRGDTDKYRPSYRSSKFRTFSKLKELYHKDRLHKLSREARKEAYDLSSYGRDIINSLKADIHNYRGTTDMKALTDIFKKHGFKRVEDFIEFLDDKWYAIRNKYRNMGIRDGNMPKTEEDEMEFVTLNSLNIKDFFDIGIVPSEKVQIALVKNDPYAIKYLKDGGITPSAKVRSVAAKSEKR